MQELFKLIDGHKTYLISVVAAAYLFGGTLNWWPVDERILGLLGFGGLAALRGGIKKVEL